MNNKNRTLDDLSSLYNATVNFKNLAPWEWMRDSDLFSAELIEEIINDKKEFEEKLKNRN
ncbi:hypothetical protein A2Y83_04915 [Candidatus Falkowbacteria bacterium RBG_13_39_14]|uniref:Uncharacterized protein n=1 Tax=Candidatus Falkowbacteria bacterium RBG_13_39_14 TaxID=1797985 RepID=A0A1F5S7I7_9BACT|nr:MAG: hypothetical protein A2Y83_04915 [Candidatus Falkowbacteria bacterium RBG_13_39_14]